MSAEMIVVLVLTFASFGSLVWVEVKSRRDRARSLGTPQNAETAQTLPQNPAPRENRR